MIGCIAEHPVNRVEELLPWKAVTDRHIEGRAEGAYSRAEGRLMKHPAADSLAALKNVDWPISNGGQISLGAVGSVECVAVASDESDCLAMLQRRDGESFYQLLTRLDAAIARAWDEGEFTDESNPHG